MGVTLPVLKYLAFTVSEKVAVEDSGPKRNENGLMVQSCTVHCDNHQLPGVILNYSN